MHRLIQKKYVVIEFNTIFRLFGEAEFLVTRITYSDTCIKDLISTTIFLKGRILSERSPSVYLLIYSFSQRS